MPVSKTIRVIGGVLVGGILLLFSACQKIQPVTANLSGYPDLNALMLEQLAILEGKAIEKTVSLDKETAVNKLELDSAQWAQELSFFKEIDPSQPVYAGALARTEKADEITLELKPGEKGALKHITFSGPEGEYAHIRASFHEDKDVYIHHREITVTFDGGHIETYQIIGYQKMLLKDTVKFEVLGKVLF